MNCNPLIAWSLLALLFLTQCARAADRVPEILTDVKRILFIGDSITFGGGYIDLIDATLRTKFSQRRFEVINVGLGSETASGMSEPDHPFPRPNVHERLERALAETQPDLVFACYGMNDGIYYPLNDVRMKAYQEGMTNLVEKVKAAGAKLVVLTPPAFDPTPMKKTAPAGETEYGYKNPYREYDTVLAAFGEWLMTQRESRGWTVIDIHGPMIAHLDGARKENPDFVLAGDGVHPNATGHRIIAQAVLEGLEMTDVDLSKLNPTLLKLVEQRQRVLRDGHLAKIGAKHPGVPKGLALDEAKGRAREIERQIDGLLK